MIAVPIQSAVFPLDDPLAMVGMEFLFRIWYFPLCLGRRGHPN